MKVEIIASGSRGNCVVIEDELIIDVGVEPPLKGSVVLLTHQHTDHTKALDKVQGLPIWATRETAEALADKFPYIEFSILGSGNVYKFNTPSGKEFYVHPIKLKHDAPCVGYDITCDGERILYATDFNEILDEIDVRDYTALYLECNNTLSHKNMHEVFFADVKPKDEFHRRKSFYNHCNIGYLKSLFTRAGFDENNRCEIPLTLMHKSSYFYASNPEAVVELCKIANVQNPLD